MKLNVNGQNHTLDVEPEMPLLWALRDELDIKGPKYGCGIAQCGSCTVLLNGEPVRSCSYPVTSADGQQVISIEGLADKGKLHAVQQAWIDHQVPQCGYCQSGQIMAAADVLKQAKAPLSREQALERMSGNVCRCGTYNQIAAAVVRAQKTLA